MLVGDLVYNDDFDINCNYEIYDCTENDYWYEAPVIFSTFKDRWLKPLDRILDMHIKYITIDIKKNSIVIEATRNMLTIQATNTYIRKTDIGQRLEAVKALEKNQS